MMDLRQGLKAVSTLILTALMLSPVVPLTVGARSNERATTSGDQFVSSKDNQFAKGQSHRKIAADLEETINKAASKGKGDQVAPVIIRLADDKSGMSDGDLQGKFANRKGKLKKRFTSMGMASAELPLSKISELMNDDDIAYVSPDRPVASYGHVEITTGAAQEDARTEVAGFTSINGTGVGIAVLDSGIDDTHNLIKASTGRPAIVYSRTYTGIAANRDYYGHGTHVASLLMGNPGYRWDFYGGIAYEAKIISLGVLDASGQGQSSNVVDALDWCVANKAAFNIRVINMSLGTPAKDSYKNDPLCLAARRAYSAGIVVVASAGNRGKNTLGQKLYGGIDSPGIEPSVITVGAANTFGTNTRSDDNIATYSSRGPTRGYATDLSGTKYYDNLVKPDIVAPGNKLIGATSPSSIGKQTSLITLNPALKVGIAWLPTDQMMYMSGTSMATPIVAAVAAMMLEANSSLTPGLVKAILMYTAQSIKGFNTLEQCAGEVNAEGAVRVAGWVKTNASSLSQGSSMLNNWNEVDQANYIYSLGERVDWGRGIIANYSVLYGSDLMTKWQGLDGQDDLWSDAMIVTDGVLR